MERRRISALLALAVCLLLGGCTLPGADLTANAAPASVNEDALDATGYATDESATIALNETIGIGGEDREVGVKNTIRTYAHTEHEGRFVVFSTPNPDTDGAPVNPFANRSERPDVARMLGEVNNTSALTVENRQNVTMVGQQAELVTYATSNHSSEGTMPVFVHVAVAQDAGDAVVAVGVHPQSIEGSDAMTRLVENIDHGESA